jgi:hypothetical protein
VNTPIVDFYLIIVKDSTIHIFYYWVINDKNKTESIQKNLVNSKTLNELLQNLENHLKQEKIMINLKNIFR